jgi:hypothetical protein
MEHLGVKLDAVETSLAVLDRGKGRILGDPDGLEAGRQPDDLVPVRIPDPETAGEPGEEPAGFPDGERAMAVFAMLAPRRPATPSSKIRGSGSGAFRAKTLLGPPERMMPMTPSALSCAAAVVKW